MRWILMRIARRWRFVAVAVTCFALAAVAPLGGLFATWTTARTAELLLTLAGGAVAAGATALAPAGGRPDTAPARLPDFPENFAGRERELADLRELYDEQSEQRRRRFRRTAAPLPNARARTVLIHGQPGVGKRALARAFARSIEAEHPDGALYFDLATASVPKGSAEILGAMLIDLGVHPDATTDARIRQFRTATSRRRVLILLENATSLDQVKNLVPNHAGCTVVITSRRTLGGSFGPHSLRLGLPDSSRAARMLYEHASLPPNTAPLEIAEVLELCGRLPSALQVGGEIIDGRAAELADLPTRLAPERRRLRALCGVDGSVEREIRQVYDELGERERRALRHLSLIESSTFLPWVLMPLLNLGYDDAYAAMKRLAEVELVQRVSADEVLGISRYRLHALTRSFAYAELDEKEPPKRQSAARGRLDSAFLAMTHAIMARLDPSMPAAAGRVASAGLALIPDQDHVIARLADNPDYWVRAEYGHLVVGVDLAYEQRNWPLCWRIAARLGGCVPLYVPVSTCQDAFVKARESARIDGSEYGEILVCLAHASLLVAIEDYAQALRLLHEVDDLIGAYTPGSGHEPSRTSLRAARMRTEGEMWLQAASYRAAEDKLGTALKELSTSKDEVEQQRIGVLAAEAAAALSKEQWLAEPARTEGNPMDDRAAFRARLARAEWARRQMRWTDAEVALAAARGFNHGDARRRAAVEYRFAKLRLSQCRSTRNPTLHAEYGADALVHAATASFRFSRMGNRVGSIRARCMVVLALVELGALDEATRQSARAKQELALLRKSAETDEILVPLRARVARAEGILDLRRGEHDNAQARLQEAIADFRGVGDWWSAAECELCLGQVLQKLGETTTANANLWPACDAFEKCGDTFNVARVRRALANSSSDDPRLTIRRLRVRPPRSPATGSSSPTRKTRPPRLN
ncbi:hypothetical protein KDL01_36600 [Actinospica durhamensis]|uniref:AAA+ ATPase domain-containing protein n=1 Tax=Actinospica durhamensis TaxID=1508375 RepID=A0A941IRI8_9ACTN|nr:hypothetical protein [Actinospica durhamensis]MBR7838845.1 hypothetical protein [Actinospica durhamensis]